MTIASPQCPQTPPAAPGTAEGNRASRAKEHACYTALAGEAWALVKRLEGEAQSEFKIGIHTTPRWNKIMNAAFRSQDRYQRRIARVRKLGMDETQVQELNIGDKVLFRGQTLIVKDWNCHHDAVFGPNSRRIWAEPIFVNDFNQRCHVPSCDWQELVPFEE